MSTRKVFDFGSRIDIVQCSITKLKLIITCKFSLLSKQRIYLNKK